MDVSHKMSKDRTANPSKRTASDSGRDEPEQISKKMRPEKECNESVQEEGLLGGKGTDGAVAKSETSREETPGSVASECCETGASTGDVAEEVCC